MTFAALKGEYRRMEGPVSKKRKREVVEVVDDIEETMANIKVTEVFDSVEDGLTCLRELAITRQSCESKVKDAIKR
jgi:hypothetical protein